MYVTQRCFLLVSFFLFIVFFNTQVSHRNTSNCMSVYNFKSDWHCGVQGKTYQGQIQKIHWSVGGCVGHLPAIKILFISTRIPFKNYEEFHRKRKGTRSPCPNPKFIHAQYWPSFFQEQVARKGLESVFPYVRIC